MSAWVYRAYDPEGRLIYVGSTTNLSGRLDTHRSASWWAYQVARIKAVVLPDMPTARAEERRAIATENPRWNVVGRWRSRHCWNEQDYCDYLLARSRYPLTYQTQRHIARVRDEFAVRFGVPMPPLLPERAA